MVCLAGGQRGKFGVTRETSKTRGAVVPRRGAAGLGCKGSSAIRVPNSTARGPRRIQLPAGRGNLPTGAVDQSAASDVEALRDFPCDFSADVWQQVSAGAGAVPGVGL